MSFKCFFLFKLHCYLQPPRSYLTNYACLSTPKRKLNQPTSLRNQSIFHEGLMGSFMREMGIRQKIRSWTWDLSHLPTAAFQRIPGMRRTSSKVQESWGIRTMAQWLMIMRKWQFLEWLQGPVKGSNPTQSQGIQEKQLSHCYSALSSSNSLPLIV